MDTQLQQCRDWRRFPSENDDSMCVSSCGFWGGVFEGGREGGGGA
jgi:hypothetical protein